MELNWIGWSELSGRERALTLALRQEALRERQPSLRGRLYITSGQQQGLQLRRRRLLLAGRE